VPSRRMAATPICDSQAASVAFSTTPVSKFLALLPIANGFFLAPQAEWRERNPRFADDKEQAVPG